MFVCFHFVSSIGSPLEAILFHIHLPSVSFVLVCRLAVGVTWEGITMACFYGDLVPGHWGQLVPVSEVNCIEFVLDMSHLLLVSGHSH